MVLSIGMIVKNEEKYLRQCLTALQPLRDAVDSELIIVDTGSTDSTVEIAREFTDKVLFFEWINDFAAARNVSLKAAKGEWYMFVDGDEVFQSCDDLIYFFTSGEYKQFNSALFNVRSYEDIKTKTRFMDCYIPRLTKILPETEFQGVVHERLTTFGHPKRILTDIADHYGYAFTNNNEFKQEKFERNSALLLERLKTDEKDNSPALYKELFDTYNFLDDKTQAIEYAYQGIEICKKLKTDYIFALYHVLTFSMFGRYQDEEVLKLCDEYFSVDPEIKVKERSLDIEFYGFKALTLYRLDRYEEAYREFRNFIELDEKMKREGICTREALYVGRNFANDNSITDINLFYTETCIKLGRYKDAEANIRKLPLDKFNYSRAIHIMRLNQLINYLKCTEARALSTIYGTLDEEDRQLFLDAIRFRLFSWEKDEQRSMINKLIAMNFSKSVYNKLSLIHKEHFLERGTDAQRVENFIHEFGARYPDLFCIMIDENMDITPYLNASSDISNDINACFKNIVGFGDKLKNYDLKNLNDNNSLIHLVKIYTQCAVNTAAIRDELMEYTKLAGECAMKYIQVFGEEYVPDDVLAAVVIQQINMLLDRKSYKECIAALRQLIQINTKFAPIAKSYQQIIKDDMAGA